MTKLRGAQSLFGNVLFPDRNFLFWVSQKPASKTKLEAASATKGMYSIDICVPMPGSGTEYSAKAHAGPRNLSLFIPSSFPRLTHPQKSTFLFLVEIIPSMTGDVSACVAG
jgi:hypothetical protein